MKVKFNQLIRSLSSQDYHSMSGTYSSSNLKMLLEDPKKFYNIHISKSKEKDWIPAFDIGTYFHTAILEPHLLKLECVTFPGIRRGSKWEDFKAKNKNKAIITKAEETQVTQLIEGVKKSPVAMGLLKVSEVEVSTFVELGISGDLIYSPFHGKVLDIGTGWRNEKAPKQFDRKIVVKVRADALGPDFILDLKSCSGNVAADWQIMNKVSDQNYDLSAALYLDIFSLVLDTKMEKIS